MLFNLESYDVMGLFIPDSGLKLYLTPPGLSDQFGDVFVDWSSEINLPPGYDHALTVHLRELSKISEPYSDCQDYKKTDLYKFNTKRECEHFCLLE